MKSLLKVSLLAAAVSLVLGCDQKEAPAAPKDAAQSFASVVAPVKLEAKNEKVAYALGASFGKYLKSSLDRPKEVGIELNTQLVLRGIQDIFANVAILDEEEGKKILMSFDESMRKKMDEKNKADLSKAKAEGDAFRAEFEKNEKDVKKTESGLLYQVVKAGSGTQPKAEDTVTVHYTGTLIDGTKFDSSYDHDKPAEFQLNRVIPGWTEGVQLMKPGAEYKFVIPSELAYGDRTSPKIPGGSTLIFEVKLLSVKPADAPKAQKLDKKAVEAVEEVVKPQRDQAQEKVKEIKDKVATEVQVQ